MSDTGALRPQFWVLRQQTNTMVPLIAVDELPPTINIRGVPRALEAKDLIGMTCAGSAESHHRTYIVDMPNEPTASRAAKTDNGRGLTDSVYANSDYNLGPTTNPNIFPQPPKAYGILEQMPSHIKSPITGNQVPVSSFTSPPTFNAPLRVDRNPGPNPLPPWQDSTAVPMRVAPGVKEYCSYWLRCGECDYAQQGCLYKHEMPLDRDILERLGHRDIPKWYREKHGLGSFLTGGNGISGEKNEKMERSWRNAREAEDRERDSGGRSDGRVHNKKRGDKVLGSAGRAGKNADKKATLWREDWEKKGDGRFAPKNTDKTVVSPISSPPAAPVRKISPVKARGPATRRSTPTTTTAASNNGHYQSPLAKKTDEDCLAALQADTYAKSRELEELKRLQGHQVLQPQRRDQFAAQIRTPEISSSEESADFEYGSKEDESEWVEGDIETQAIGVSNDLKAARLLKKGKWVAVGEAAVSE